MCFAPQRRALFPHCTFWLRNVLRATTACTFSTSQLPKVVRPWCVLTSKCASHHQGVHFFDISTSNLVRQWCVSCILTSKFEMCFAPQRRALFRHLNFKKMVRPCCVLYILTSKCASRHRRALFRHLNFQKWSDHGVFWLRNVLRTTTACTFSTSQHISTSNLVRQWCVSCILTSKFEMCFAPQRHAPFRHLNFKKWSDHGVFCTFWLRNVLRATTACTFSTSQLPKVVRPWCVLTSKCASHHNGVHFFISHLASWLRTRRFSEPTFRPSGATNHWKNIVFRDFPTFSRICICFLLNLSLLWSSLF